MPPKRPTRKAAEKALKAMAEALDPAPLEPSSEPTEGVLLLEPLSSPVKATAKAGRAGTNDHTQAGSSASEPQPAALPLLSRMTTQKKQSEPAATDLAVTVVALPSINPSFTPSTTAHSLTSSSPPSSPLPPTKRRPLTKSATAPPAILPVAAPSASPPRSPPKPPIQKAHSIAEEDFFARKNLDADDDYEEDDFEIAAKIAAKIAASTKLNENAPDEPDSDEEFKVRRRKRKPSTAVDTKSKVQKLNHPVLQKKKSAVDLLSSSDSDSEAPPSQEPTLSASSSQAASSSSKPVLSSSQNKIQLDSDSDSEDEATKSAELARARVVAAREREKLRSDYLARTADVGPSLFSNIDDMNFTVNKKLLEENKGNSRAERATVDADKTVLVKVAQMKDPRLSDAPEEAPKVYKIKMVQSLERILKSYCDEKKMSVQDTVFKYKGARVFPTVTPSALNFSSKETIYAASPELDMYIQYIDRAKLVEMAEKQRDVDFATQVAAEERRLLAQTTHVSESFRDDDDLQLVDPADVPKQPPVQPTFIEPDTADAGDSVSLKIQFADKTVLKVRVKKTQRMEKIIKYASDKSNTPMNKLELRCDGQVVHANDTAESLDLESDMVLEAKIR